MNKSFRPELVIAIVLFATIARIAVKIPPIDAIAIFAGAYCARRSMALLITLLSIWVGDLFLNYLYYDHFVLFYSGFYWQYGCYVLMVLLGGQLKSRSLLAFLFATVGAAMMFFIISNFGVWLNWNLYPHTIAGLITCYIAALPFLKISLLSGMAYSVILFGGITLALKFKTSVV
jgi:hypothetical protein